MTKPCDIIEEAIKASAQYEESGLDDVDAPVLANWVLVAEWITPDDQRVLSTVERDGASPFHTMGLLHSALAMECGSIGGSNESDEP